MSCNRAIFKKIKRILRGLLFLGIISITGCAYFNTLYYAKKYYRQGIKKEENNEGAGKSDFNTSLEKAVKVARDYPDSRWVDDAFYLMAMDYFRLGNYEKANIQFEGFLEYFPESPYNEEVSYRYALTFIELGQYTEGRLALRKMFTSKKFGKEAYFSWAQAFKKEEDWEGARAAFREFLESYPRGKTAHAARLNLAEIELAWGDTASAILTYERFLRRASTSEENYERMITLSELYYIQQDYSSTLKVVRKARGKYPKIDQKCDLMKAKVSLATGDTSKAIKLLRDIPSGDSRGEAFFVLASTYEVLGEFDLSLAYFDTVVTKEKRSDYASLAERKKTLLETRVAEPDSADTSTIDPAKEQFMLAQTYLLSMGDITRALLEYERVYAEYPESDYAPKALYGIAWLKRYRLEDPRWMEDMLRLIEVYPESPAAKEASEMIHDEEIEGTDS